MSKHLLLILGMAAVTYIPRLLPLIILSDIKMNKNLEKFLAYIPYTSLSILMVRGIITAEDGMEIATILGVGAAAFLAYLKGNIVLSISIAILVSFLIIQIPYI